MEATGHREGNRRGNKRMKSTKDHIWLDLAPFKLIKLGDEMNINGTVYVVKQVSTQKCYLEPKEKVALKQRRLLWM